MMGCKIEGIELKKNPRFEKDFIIRGKTNRKLSDEYKDNIEINKQNE